MILIIVGSPVTILLKNVMYIIIKLILKCLNNLEVFIWNIQHFIMLLQGIVNYICTCMYILISQTKLQRPILDLLASAEYKPKFGKTTIISTIGPLKQLTNMLRYHWVHDHTQVLMSSINKLITISENLIGFSAGQVLT